MINKCWQMNLIAVLILAFLLAASCEDTMVTSDVTTWYTEVGTAGMDYANDIVATDDGGFVIVGQTENYPATVRDAFVAKIDGNGDVVWQGSYGRESYDWANAVTAAPDGGYVIAGQSVITPEPPGDAYIFKIDSEGKLIWARSFGGSGWDEITDVVTTSDGAFVAAGRTEVIEGSYLMNIYLLKVDADGDLLWEKTIGGSSNTDTHAFAQTHDGGFIIVDVGVEIWDRRRYFYLIRRTNSDGDLLYEKRVNSELAEGCTAILPTSDNGFILLGKAWRYCEDCFDPLYDINLMKIDDAANLVWEKTIDVGDNDNPYSISAMPDGGFVISGRTDDYDDNLPGYTHLVRTAHDGAALWKSSFIFNDRIYGNTVTACSDGGIVVSGRVYLPESGYDAFVMKVDARGRLFYE